MGEASLVQYAIKNMGLVAHHAAQNKIRENQRIISTLARDVEGGAEVDVVVQEAGVDSVREEVAAAEVQVAEGGQKDLVSQEDQLLEENRSACILPHALYTWKYCIFIAITYSVSMWSSFFLEKHFRSSCLVTGGVGELCRSDTNATTRGVISRIESLQERESICKIGYQSSKQYRNVKGVLMKSSPSPELLLKSLVMR